MHPQQLRKKAKLRSSSSFTRRTSGPSISYLKTRIRGSRLQNAAHILVLIELTKRLHQAYRFAYDKQAADQLLPQNPVSDFGLGPPPPPPRLGIFCDPDVIDAMKNAWMASANGKPASEGGGREGSFNLTGSPANYTIVPDKFTNEVAFHSIRIIGQFANFHTHDNESGPRPSTPDNNSQGNRLGDTGVADKYHFDIYVMSNRGLYKYDWRSKQTSAQPLRKGLDWLKPCKK